MTLELDGVRFVVGLGLLGFASYLDIKTRRVPNALWIEGAGIAGLLLAWDAYVFRRMQVQDWVFVLVVPILAYLLWRTRLIAGGADAKAIMVLALLLPTPIDLEVAGRDWPMWASPLPPALIVLVNALVVMLALPLVFFVRNASRGHWRLPSMFLGYRASLESATASHVWIMERVDPTGKLVQVLFPSRSSPEQEVANAEALRERGLKDVWVTPKIPFMVPLTIGFVATFLVGDAISQWIYGDAFVRAGHV